ncbi:hypothetical protein [Paenibacillus chungangensis]|uniref:Uncharacterized protein n=1 Tax=Paenibacillus chungangensis TaxID=696535 RepID=A0ABW3HTP1_9BACL
MTNHETSESAEQPKKLSQAERAKQLLAQKKGQSGMPGQKHFSTGTKEMKSQNTKKVNNQRKKMGV